MDILNGWLDVALEINCMHKSMPRAGYKPTMIVLHGTAGGSSAENVASWWQTSAVIASAHFAVGQDGHVIQCVDCNAAAWANGVLTPGHASYLPQLVNPNLYTISIEHVKSSTENSNQLTPLQQDASFKLIECLCEAYGIPKRPADANGGVLSHKDFDPVNRSRCPGPYPYDQLYEYLNRSKNTMLDLNDPVVKNYFTDGGNGTWKCKNGVRIWGEILKFYRSHGGPSLFGLPLSEEVHVPPSVEIALVPFERALIIFDPGRKIDNPPIPGPCYLLHADSGIGLQFLTGPLQKEIDLLNDQNTALQKQINVFQITNASLEKQVEDLSSQKPIQALQAIIMVVDQLRNES